SMSVLVARCVPALPSTVLLHPHGARRHRHSFPTRRSSDLGSGGKTTVKTMLAHILNECGAVLATKGSLNNHIGVPLTLLELQVRSEEHTSELQSRENLVCRLLLENKKTGKHNPR